MYCIVFVILGGLVLVCFELVCWVSLGCLGCFCVFKFVGWLFCFLRYDFAFRYCTGCCWLSGWVGA